MGAGPGAPRRAGFDRPARPPYVPAYGRFGDRRRAVGTAFLLGRRREIRAAEGAKDAEAEADAYNHLADSFGRYYTEGDFVSQRRYSGGGRAAYLVPYDGEEVKLHWANADQYYIKTTENYAAYAFTVGGDAGGVARRVCFEIAAADNVKEASGRQA